VSPAVSVNLAVRLTGLAFRHVKQYAGPHTALINAHCLYRFDEPVSPHLAAGMAAEKEGAQVGQRIHGRRAHSC